MVVAGYIGIVVVAAVLVVTNPNNYRSKEEKEQNMVNRLKMAVDL